ncbi:hypothetical protein DFJ73DRAFT_960679 [Zopfochytrium polystomum]|nr:hypothetical protein DFJ73DRAFT_960679 [Zopfochytrium polystomum]
MLKVTMWGKGFPGWKDDKSLVDNIEATFGARDYFDIVYTMPNGVQDLFPVNTVYVHSMGDCHGAEWEVDCEKSTWPLATPDVIVSRYAFEIFDLFNWERAKEKNRTRPILRGHHPDCADPEKLFPLPINQTREVDVQLFGAVWELYPIRMAVADAIKKELIRGKIFSHQGYFGDEKVEPTNSSLLTLPPGSVDPTDPALAHIHARYAVYAAALRNTRICVFDSSKIHKAIRKFHEAMLSGCVVASDMPDEMEDEVFRGVIIRLERHWDGQRIKQELEWYLKRPQLLDRMAIEAFKRAREHLVCEKRVDRLLQLAARARRGDVGYWFPYGFTGGCREYTDQRKPDWCP